MNFNKYIEIELDENEQDSARSQLIALWNDPANFRNFGFESEPELPSQPSDPDDPKVIEEIVAVIEAYTEKHKNNLV